jgi:hypothetical protein
MRSDGIVTPRWACGTLGSPVAKRMKKISYSGYRFPPEIIHQAIWLYLRFTLSLRDVEDLLAERGVALEEICLRPRAIGHRRFAIIQRWRLHRPLFFILDEHASDPGARCARQLANDNGRGVLAIVASQH